MPTEDEEGWSDWLVGGAMDAAGYVVATAAGAYNEVTGTVADVYDEVTGTVSDSAVFVAENLAETRDVVADTATQIVDSIGDDAATATRNAALFGPVGLAAGGLIVAVALNPSLLGNAGKSLKKLF